MKKNRKLTQKVQEQLIAYYRVSTAQQGRSGLGLEAQKSDVQRYAAGCGGEIIHEYTEVESGKRADRIQLAKAVAHARRAECKLVIAKLDRLARNVAFISALMENGFEFVCCDNPHVNRLTLHVLAAVAEEEARAVSTRTKAALAAAKARGAKLGSQRPGFWTRARRMRWLAGLPEARKRSAISRRTKAIERLADLLPAIRQQRGQGMTLQAIADSLNGERHLTPRGCIWSAATVQRALRLA